MAAVEVSESILACSSGSAFRYQESQALLSLDAFMEVHQTVFEDEK